MSPSITRKQYGRPSSDVTDANWTNESSNNTNLYDSVNDIDVDDDTYIRSGETPSGDAVTLGLSSMSTPDAGTVTIRVMARIV